MRTSCMHSYAAHLFQPYVLFEVPSTDVYQQETPYGVSGCIDAPSVMPAGSMERFVGMYYIGGLQTAIHRIF